jgi:hypothetical protein
MWRYKNGKKTADNRWGSRRGYSGIQGKKVR